MRTDYLFGCRELVLTNHQSHSIHILFTVEFLFLFSCVKIGMQGKEMPEAFNNLKYWWLGEFAVRYNQIFEKRIDLFSTANTANWKRFLSSWIFNTKLNGRIKSHLFHFTSLNHSHNEHRNCMFENWILMRWKKNQILSIF